MVGQGVAAVAGQEFGGLLDRAAGHAIDDAGIGRVLVLDKAQQIVARVVLRRRRGRTGSGGRSRRRTAAPASRCSRSAMSRRVGSSAVAVSAMQRDVGKALLEDAEGLVVAAEIVAPLRDAMRLVDREQRDAACARACRAQCGMSEALGGDVEQVERAVAQRPFDRGGLAGRQRGIERGGAHPGLAQRVDLVLHQRDQRRDDDADTRDAAAPAADSTATCRRRSASARARRRRRRRAR